MITPFDSDGRLDLDGAVSLARWLADNGSDGLVVAGTTGESATLSDQEKTDLWRAVSESVTVPVIANSGTADTEHSMELTKRATEVGAAGILVVTPYYVRPSQEGLYSHFSAVASTTQLPVMIYDIPVRTGRRVARATLLRLAREVPNVLGVKDASGDLQGAARLIAEAPDGFDLYSGEDALTLPLLSLGGAGVVGVATHWAGRLFGDMISQVAKGDLRAAASVNAQLLDSYDFESSEEAPNPVPTKTLLSVMGLPSGPTRPPMGPAPDGLDARASQLVRSLGVVGSVG